MLGAAVCFDKSSAAQANARWETIGKLLWPEPSSADHASEMLKDLQVNVATLDVEMLGLSGLQYLPLPQQAS